MKSMMQFFADELLPVFGISKKVKSLAPTEHIHIEIKTIGLTQRFMQWQRSS